MADLLIDEADWAKQFSDPELVRDKADSIRKQALAAKDPGTEGRALVLLACLENRLGIAEHAVDLFRRAMGLLSGTSDTLWARRAEFGQMLFPASVKQLEELLVRIKPELPVLDQAIISHSLAVNAFKASKTATALRYFYQALLSAQESNCQAFIIQVQDNLGTCQIALGNFLEARLQLEAALALAELHPVPRLAPLLASNLAQVLVELGENEAAFEIMHEHRSGMELVESSQRGIVPAMLAFTAIKAGRLELAANELAVAERCVQGSRLKVQLAWTRALVDQNQGRIKAALNQVQKGLELLKLTPDHHYELNLMLLAANLHAAIGDYQQAFRLQSAYLNLLRERQGEGVRSLTLSLQIRHELDETLHERDRAVFDRDEAKEANQKLRELNQVLEHRLGEIEGLKKRLREQSIKDALTGLYNRPYLEEAMFGIMRLAHRQKNPLSIAILDMDNFRELNDKYGHSFADAILVALAELLLKGSRDSDLVARYGGEEFCIVFADMEPELARQRLGAVLVDFKAIELSSAGLTMTGASFTAGIARFPTDATTFDQLITLADCAMSAAKEKGGAQVVTYASMVAVNS